MAVSAPRHVSWVLQTSIDTTLCPSQSHWDERLKIARRKFSVTFYNTILSLIEPEDEVLKKTM